MPPRPFRGASRKHRPHYANAVLDLITDGTEVHVPYIWPLEVTNVLLRAFRRRRITKEELLDYVSQLASLRLQMDLEQAAERA